MRVLLIYAAVCLACLLAALALAGSRARSRPAGLGGPVGLAANEDDADAIWSSVTGAALIEQLQEQVDSAKGEAKAALEAKMATLKQDIPDWEDITSAYSSTDAWDDIKSTSRMEDLEQAVADAKASGSEKLDDLQRELERAKAAAPSVDDIKQQASAVWQDNADKLPDLDDITAKADKLAEDMHDSVSSLVDNAFASVKKWF